MLLSELARSEVGIVDAVHALSADDVIAHRLRDLGFVSGEPVRVVATSPFGGDPIVVQIGFTRFALRHAEAARVHLRSA
ncbi:MAG TPA: FeoA family protein [Burkholderiaceae bacterium]|jgi:ferrous iron transport protein A|nr:FeoA family protein [Burkholderiaceae bacterium]